MTGWDDIAAIALALPGATPSTHYGKPAVKAHGRAIITAADDQGSFVLHIDAETKAILLATDPATYWQTPHYEGWPALLVRYDSTDPDRVAAMIGRAYAWAGERRPLKSRARAK